MILQLTSEGGSCHHLYVMNAECDHLKQMLHSIITKYLDMMNGDSSLLPCLD